MAKRKSTGKRQRFNIFKRDEFKCQYCGRTPPTVVLVLDHIIPVAAGGETVDHNLITACEACNQGKADVLLVDVPQSIDSSLAQQVERREQLEAFNEMLLEAHNRDEESARAIGRRWNNRISPASERDKWTFGSSRIASVLIFLQRLPITDIYEAVDIALARKHATTRNDEPAWKYFCGVCWKKIRDREGTR